MLGAAALIAIISGAAIVGHAAIMAGQSRSSHAHLAVRALEPGFTGTFLYRNDNFRTGQNLAESVLTPSTVSNPALFGLVFTDPIDAAAYAQPLYVPNVAIPNLGTHNVVYVATENDSVYAFDADQPGPPLWQTSFINPAAGITPVPSTDLGGGCADLVPIIGITATPVIDPATGTLYVVSKVKLGAGSYQQQLHALDITTGFERPNSPATIAAKVPGTAEDSVKGIVHFNPLLQHDRPALTIANGVVYLSFASHCDIGPYHGWILGYDETTLAQEVVYNTTPDGDAGGIWESGCGPGVDTNGDLIAITGNGTFETSQPDDYGDSFLRLTPVGGTMSVTSSFTPLNELLLDDDDLDMGSGGNLLLPVQPGPNPDLMIGAGKVGTLYLINRDSMGGFHASNDQMVQELPAAVGGMFSTPAYWQGTVPNVGLQNMVYTIGVNDVPKMFVLSNGLLQTPPISASSSFSFGFPGASPVISANGTTGGILWAIDSTYWSSSTISAVLRAFDATNLTELYDSNMFIADHPGPPVKFTVPTVANGSVYVGTQTQLAVFGLFAGGRGAPTPTATATASATATSTATTTATATDTVTATPTASITNTPAATLTATITATSVATPTVTASSVMPTATPTDTPTPTASPSPVFATLKANPTSISFSNQVVGHQGKAAKVTVINTAATAEVSLSQPTASSGFIVTSSNCPTVMPPGSSCKIEVAFAPTAKGRQNGQLQLTSNAKYGVRAIKLKGKGVAPKMNTRPKSLSFEQTSPDAVSSPHSITVVNDSPAPISFTTAPAATPPFNVTANTCTTIAPNGGTCAISVEFAPHTHGKYQGTLEIHDNAANSPQHIKLFGSSK